MNQLPTESFQDCDVKPYFLEKPASLIEERYLQRSLASYNENNLVHYLKLCFGEQKALELIQQFKIGTISGPQGWPGASVLWQINSQNEIRSGKIVMIDPVTGKFPQEPIHKQLLMHKVLKLTGFNRRACLFGEHQLSARLTDTLAIVANEVTAIVATAFYPECVWLACESTNNLDVLLCQGLSGRNVVLYPNLSVNGEAFKRWSRKADDLKKALNCQIRVSRYLEDNASEGERTAGMDIADFLLRSTNSANTNLAKGDNCNLIQPDSAASITASVSVYQPLSAGSIC